MLRIEEKSEAEELPPSTTRTRQPKIIRTYILFTPPVKPNANQKLNSFNRQVSRLPIVQFLMLRLLIVYPSSQRDVFFPLLRDVAVAVHIFVSFEFHKSIHPTRRIPNPTLQPHSLQQPYPLLGKLRRLPLLAKLQLSPLQTHPRVQLRTLLVLLRYPRRAVLPVELHQFGIPIVPELIPTDAGPLESDVVEEVDARLGHVVGLALVEEFVLLFLGADPGVELFAVAVVVGYWYVESSVLFLVQLEFLITL
mmetsp:Transcript_12550/g.20437  ORF Transcript_12550/g.20437 Transcript_12550/m.20437 type:complete len:251 (+) Transcript_12550:123-875(+)